MPWLPFPLRSPPPWLRAEQALVRRGVRVAVDVGSVRIGVARCDTDGLLATPVETVPRGDGDIERIAAVVDEAEAVEVVVGHPVTLAGERGPAAIEAEDFAARVAAAVAPLPVRLVDERLTTASAARSLRAAGRDAKSSRSVIDQQAAVALLQDALDRERSTGRPAGSPVTGPA